MRFAPKTLEELQIEDLLPEGHYPFTVKAAKEKISKAGNEMLELQLDINGRVVWDYLLESMFYKLHHFCEFTGLADKYSDGTLTAEDCIGKSGKVSIVIQPPKDGYNSKNSVKDYVAQGDTFSGQASQSFPTLRKVAFENDGEKMDTHGFDDSIPF